MYPLMTKFFYMFLYSDILSSFLHFYIHIDLFNYNIRSYAFSKYYLPQPTNLFNHSKNPRPYNSIFFPFPFKRHPLCISYDGYSLRGYMQFFYLFVLNRRFLFCSKSCVWKLHTSCHFIYFRSIKKCPGYA